jgi:hypothetical protein
MSSLEEQSFQNLVECYREELELVHKGIPFPQALPYPQIRRKMKKRGVTKRSYTTGGKGHRITILTERALKVLGFKSSCKK